MLLTLADHHKPTNLQRVHRFRHPDDCYMRRCWYLDPFWRASGSWGWQTEIAEIGVNWDEKW